MYAICGCDLNLRFVVAICNCDLCTRFVLRFVPAIWGLIRAAIHGCDLCCDSCMQFLHAISAPPRCLHASTKKNVHKLTQKTLQKKHQTQHLNPEHAPPRASHQLCCVGDKTHVYGTLRSATPHSPQLRLVLRFWR